MQANKLNQPQDGNYFFGVVELVAQKDEKIK